MVLEALAEEVILGIPAVELGPRILNLNLVSAVKLLDFEVHPLLMFPDVDMLTSKRLVRDIADTLYWLQSPPLASTVPCMCNEIHAHMPI